jgi:hypothetical protein
VSNRTRCMLIHFNTNFIILATCFGYVIAIIRPTRTVELALDAALSGMKRDFSGCQLRFEFETSKQGSEKCTCGEVIT